VEHKWHEEGRKDLKVQNGSKGNNGTGIKKSHLGHGCLSLVSVVCCQVEVSATGWSLVQRTPTECGVCNWVWSWSLEKWGGLGPQGAVEPLEKNYIYTIYFNVKNYSEFCHQSVFSPVCSVWLSQICLFNGAVERFPWHRNLIYHNDNSRNAQKIIPFPSRKKFQLLLTQSQLILFTRLHHLEDVQVILPSRKLARVQHSDLWCGPITCKLFKKSLHQNMYLWISTFSN
jgi:hypothetical protein